VLIVGAAGQLGRAMIHGLSAEWRVVGSTRADLDLADAAAVHRVVNEVRPGTIVNCAAYNQVDRAETEPVAALDANACAVLTLARAAESVGATLVHYSSDFVFDGETDRPYVEEDLPEPRSTYAASKLAGEWFAAGATSHYVVRVESLFGGAERRKSSMDRIIDAVLAGGPAKVFVDRVVSPSYVWDVVMATTAMLKTRPAAGIYHCVNTGAATWHDLAVEVRRQVGSDAVLEPIRLQDVKLPAERPRYCALSNDKLKRAGIVMPPWQDAVARALAERKN
jgi:dTDP-4-dehydrorhamnose reductase